LADLDHHSGEVSLGERKQQQTSPAAWRKQIGYLSPDAIFWTETMAEYFMRFKEPAIAELLRYLELEPLLEKPMNKLSSGEKQRCGLGRLLANQPDALLLDEPTSHLDPASVTLAESAIRDYQEHHGCPMILVSHDNEQCRRMTRQCFSMQNKRLHAA
jgi:ABC-type multidrug transport system ATPase subunit